MTMAASIKTKPMRRGTSPMHKVIDKSFLHDKHLPIVYKPLSAEAQAHGFLPRWIAANRKEVERDLTIYGAVLLRGFATESEKDFEDAVLAFDKNLGTEYLGTSPRNGVTKYVHTASELPPAYPIMQHAEMSFLDNPPRRLFFYAKTAPAKDGETPLTDLRAVHRDINDELRKKFRERGVEYVRRYDGPGASRFSFWKTKRWDEMFATNDKKQVQDKAQAQRFELSWLKDNGLKISNRQNAFRKHPTAGTLAWHNHSQTFHIDSAAIEYGHILRRQKSPRALGVYLVLQVLTLIKKLFRSSSEQDVNALFGDGQPIKRSEIRNVVNAFWKNLSVFAWQTGDILLIDNFSVSHGRLPYKGPREILVAWTDY
jgi:alpha-ketoglutarate-dependent taurine dioxygenase